MYYEGKGVSQNFIHAYLWLSLAISNDHKTAVGLRDKALKNLSPDQIATAQQLSKQKAKEIAQRQPINGINLKTQDSNQPAYHTEMDKKSDKSEKEFKKAEISVQVEKCENLKIELDKTIAILYKPPLSGLTADPDISKSLFTHAKAQDTGSKLILRVITDNCFKHFKWKNTPGL